MKIYPAIDMYGGRVVRLFQGDYDQMERYDLTPAEAAMNFKQAGATRLHIVDLDGAQTGKPRNFASIKRIGTVGGLFIEMGGGIRDEDTVVQCFAAGVNRVILGTKALQDRDFTEAMIQTYGSAVAVGVDARDGKVAIEGWLETSDVDSVDFCKEMSCLGVKHIIYTDIARDGAMTGANLKIYETLAGISDLDITASGGVATLQDIADLRDLGLYGAILGKSLYNDTIVLEEALAVARGEML